MCTVAVLAGGRATRFGGRDKSALVIGGERLIERQVAAARGVCEQVLVVAIENERFRALGLRVVPDLYPGGGALGGIYTAIAAAATPRTLVIACDMPFLTEDFMRHVVASCEGVDLAIPRTRRGYEPLCACYAPGCLEPIRRRLELGRLAAHQVVGDVRVREIGPEEIAPYDPDGMLLLNVNSPAEYERALARAAHLDSAATRASGRS